MFAATKGAPAPMPLPVGLALLALVFDVIFVTTGYACLTTIAYWVVVGTAAASVVTTCSATVDALAATGGGRWRPLYATASGVVAATFSAAAALRWDAIAHMPDVRTVILECVGFAAALWAAWLTERFDAHAAGAPA